MPEHSERLTLLNALIKTAEAECRDEWARFCQLAPLLEGSSGSPEDNARRRLSRINQYDASLAWVSGGRAGDREFYEAGEIRRKLLDQFLRAIHARRWSIFGYLKGELRPTLVPVERIEAKAFRFDANKLCLRDGTEVSDVFVVPAVPASLSPAETRGGPEGGPAENQPKKRKPKKRKKRRSRYRADPVQSVAKELWPPDGKAPKTMSAADALELLGEKLDEQKIKASDTTLRRVIGKRPR